MRPIVAPAGTLATTRLDERIVGGPASFDPNVTDVAPVRSWPSIVTAAPTTPFAAETTEAVREYAAPLKDAGVDTVILGCTHYPLIRPIFQRVFGRGVTLVFSAEETAREVAETLARKGIENEEAREGSYRFLTTGDPAAFRALGERFLQLVDALRQLDLELDHTHADIHPRPQLVLVERLGDVVVGAGGQTADDVHLLVFGGQ